MVYNFDDPSAKPKRLRNLFKEVAKQKKPKHLGVKLVLASSTALAALSLAGSTVAESSLPSAPNDLMLSLASPLSGADVQTMISSGEHSLGVRPDVVQIKANNHDAAESEMIAAIKAQIIKNGGPLSVIEITGHGLINAMVLPEPSPDGVVGMPHTPPNARFDTIGITNLLQAMTSLQDEEFPGHKAGDPLAKTFIVAGCDLFKGERQGAAQDLFQLSEQLRMRIVASAIQVGSDGLKTYGDFSVIMPDGTWSPLPGSSWNTGENAQQNKAWLNNFPQRTVTEPKPNDPFSITALPTTPGERTVAITPKGALPKFPVR